MVAQALQEQILQGNTGRVLEAITNAEALLGRQDIDFPRIAVFGDESTGKSSMLEAICKIPFPRGNQTTTRCPTSLRMQRKPGASWSATAWAGYEMAKRKNETHVRKPEDLTKVIRDLQSTILSDGSSFSTEPVSISIEAEDAVDLTLVDLPGYYTTEDLDGAENSDDISRIKESLLTYLSDENTIVLVVVPANQLVKTVNIFSLLKDYKKRLSEVDRVKLQARTIYCFTMCDLVGATQDSQKDASYDIEEILYNKGRFSADPHGCDREFEDTFFAQHAPYNKPDLRSRCGTRNLVRKLSSLLAEKISEKVPTMLWQTDIALSQATKELSSLGAPPPENRNLEYECRTIIGDIKEYFVQATEGIYGRLTSDVEDLAEDISEEDLEKCELSYRRKLRCESFAEEIKAARLPLDDDKYLAELRVKVEKAVNGKFELVMPIPEVLFEEVRICAKKWRGLGEAMCNEIANAAIECLEVLVRVKASKYENLPGILNEYLTAMINEQRDKAQNRLDWLYVDEIVRPNTLNELLEKKIDSMSKVPGLGKNKDGNRDAYVCYLKAYLPIAEARYIDNAVRAVMTHILDVPKASSMTRVASEKNPKYSFLALQFCDEHDMEDTMKSRDDLSEKRESQTAKVNVLTELRDSLRAMPAAKTAPQAVPTSKEAPQEGHRWVGDEIRTDDVAWTPQSNDVAREEEKVIPTGPDERLSFMERMKKLRLDSGKH